MEYGNPDYKWFVCVREKAKNAAQSGEPQFTVCSGWEYKDDAQDDVNENEAYYKTRADGEVKIFSRKYLKSVGVDPDMSEWWMKG